MKNRKIAAIFLVAAAFLAAFLAYPIMPEKTITHWNAKGEADGHMEKGVGSFFMPILAFCLLALFFILPKIDPLKKNYPAFENEYWNFVVLLIAFFDYVYFLTLAINMGHGINMVQCLSPAFGVLFFYSGVLIEKAKQNWFIGVRTPWTLANKRVWNKTHAITGKLFKAAGAIALLGMLMPEVGMTASIATILVASVFSFAYSYFEYEKEKSIR